MKVCILKQLGNYYMLDESSRLQGKAVLCVVLSSRVQRNCLCLNFVLNIKRSLSPFMFVAQK